MMTLMNDQGLFYTSVAQRPHPRNHWLWETIQCVCVCVWAWLPSRPTHHCVCHHARRRRSRKGHDRRRLRWHNNMRWVRLQNQDVRLLASWFIHGRETLGEDSRSWWWGFPRESGFISSSINRSIQSSRQRRGNFGAGCYYWRTNWTPAGAPTELLEAAVSRIALHNANVLIQSSRLNCISGETGKAMAVYLDASKKT